jgi:short-subunit dehydrogenase
MSSAMALTASYPVCVYGAGKAYVHALSQFLQQELKKQHEVQVLSVTPATVTTRMTEFRRTSAFDVSPEQCAEGALRDLCAGRTHSYGAPMHWFVGLSLQMLERDYRWIYDRSLIREMLIVTRRFWE